MQSKQAYQAVQTGEDADIWYSRDRITEYTDNDPDEEEEDENKLILSITPERSSRLYRSRPICDCHRLTGTCIATFAATVLMIIGLIIAGAYLAYKGNLIDGQSPPWYPSPHGGTSSNWTDSYAKAQKLVERMTLVEKVNITTGTGWAMDLCVGTTGRAADAGFPALCLQDGPLGIRFADHSDSFPAGVTVGSTWNRTLMRMRGEAHGRQARLKGVNVLLGPSMGPLGRNPAGGRNWEGFGSDPVLQAIAAAETIKGIQSQGVQATAKHFIGNEQEHFRKSFEWGLPEALSSNIDDRTLHELYLWPFAESVRAGVVSVMCSYQMVNNSYACQNSWLLNGILKDELGFQGYVQSDWLAQRSGVASALAGLDMSMPGDGLYWQNGKSLYGEQLTISVLNGSVPIDRLNDMATRIVAAWYQVGQDSWESDGPNFSSWTDEKIGKWHNAASDSKDEGVVNKFVQTSTTESQQLAREIARDGIVLLKNNESILPLQRDMAGLGLDRKINVVVVGEDAGPGKGPNFCADRGCNQGTLLSGWGSGASEFPYSVDPYSALQKAFDTSKVQLSGILTNSLSSAQLKNVSNQDVCIVFANSDAGEGYIAWNGVRGDRNDLELQKGGVKLIQQVAGKCNGPVIVVIHSVGPVIMEQFADLPSVKAIVLANLPGQESGNALKDMLFGDVDASGRLVYTVGRSLADYGDGAPVLYYPNSVVPQADFKEGIYIDYRHFDKHGVEPRFPFGFGLSYTTFEYTNLSIEALKTKSALPAPRPHGIEAPVIQSQTLDPHDALVPAGFRKLKKYIYPWISSTDQIKKGKYPYPKGYETVRTPSAAGGGQGGNPDLFEAYVKVTLNVHNTGSSAGKEVVQLYVSFPESVVDPVSKEVIDTPVQVLRNFEKTELEADETKQITLYLTRKDLSYWSVVQQNWIMPEEGKFGIAVGHHSRDIRLRGDF